jgi:hypothetical protein
MADESWEFWQDLEAWSYDTFGSKEDRGPIGPLKHLIKEAQETIEDSTNIEEYVDCLFLIFDAAQRADFGYHEFICAARDKLKKNKKRLWPKPNFNLDEPIEHIRNEDKSNPFNPNGNAK